MIAIILNTQIFHKMNFDFKDNRGHIYDHYYDKNFHYETLTYVLKDTFCPCFAFV